MGHKSGFVNILGNPNVGKSTLMNMLVGERLSIITSKAQTTRHRIVGIVNGEDFQVVYSDTPGILKPAYKLQQSMMGFVDIALKDADLILYVTDVVEDPVKNEKYIERLKKTSTNIILLLNKIDLLKNTQEIEEHVNFWKETLPNANVHAISALHKINTDHIFDEIINALPEGPEYYPKDALTDRPERFFVSEIIREKLFLNYKQEIPYSVEVGIESYQEADDIDRIRAIIYVMRESQKGIILGKKGSAIKKTGIEAREEIEAFLQKKVYLELFVKVKKDWREKDTMLRQFGY